MLVGHSQVWKGICLMQIRKETWRTQEIYAPARHLAFKGRLSTTNLRYVWGVLPALLTWWVVCAVLKGPSAVASEALGPSDPCFITSRLSLITSESFRCPQICQSEERWTTGL